MDGLPSEDFADGVSVTPVAGEERVYVVPLKWWKEAQESSSFENAGESKGILYTASSTSGYGPMKIINNIFNSDLAFNLRREDPSMQNGHAEEGISGRDYALVPGELWLKALKWHSDSHLAAKNAGSFSVSEDDMSDVYPLQLRVSVLRETNSLSVKISKRDNAVELYRRACKIFNVEYELFHMWDFSGQTALFFMRDGNKFSNQRQSDMEILLELQVYGLSDSIKAREGKKDEQSKTSFSSFRGSVMSNGSTGNMDPAFPLTNSSSLSGTRGVAGSLGLTGLQNLGNTCFMNSAIQCLAHTPKLVDYFLDDYSHEINPDNPLGMDGEVALAFGDLLRKLWAPGASPVAPRIFKSKLAHFAPQFSGFNQHDSQELLAFLLDGLHEDLNRVKCKPYVEVKDSDRKDEEVADEYWQNHLARNDSIIVDICQGQYKSTLVCPVCSKVSITFDPFMYLSLPLPSTMMRTMTVTILSTNGGSEPSPFTINVPKNGRCKDLTQALSISCSLRPDETLLVAEIYNNRIIRFLEDPFDSLPLIRDEDRLAAYRLQKDQQELPLVVFTQERMEEQYIFGKVTSSWKTFGVPLVAKLHNITNGLELSELYLKFIRPAYSGTSNANDEVSEMEEAISPPALDGEVLSDNQQNDSGLEFFLTDEKGTKIKDSKMEMNEPILVTGSTRRIYVLVCWGDKMVERYDTRLLCSLPEIPKSGFLAKRPQDADESVSLYSCLEAFLRDEPLGPEDMWYCPGCLKHRQASKKLDLWRLPEILIIHLKRFSYSRYVKNKLETFVNFPIHDLDLSTYIAYNSDQSSYRYVLYAVSNHYGSMGGGHYTAFVYHGGNQWFDFDDSRVSPINEDKIKTSAAYVLFYRRVLDE